MNMKNILQHINKSVLVLTIISLFLSCENEFEKGDIKTNTGQPVLTSVSEILNDTEVSQGVLQGTYILRGQNLSSMVSIQFNGLEAGFNPALLTDEVAFVTVPNGTPLYDQSNIMRVETLGGVVEFDFPLLHIEEFTEGVVDGKKVVNISGVGFDYTPVVTFETGSEDLGNLVERTADIISVTDNLIVAEVPAGVTQAFIFVTTARGASAKSASYGFTLPIYIDGLNEEWTTSEWGGTHDLNSTEQALGQFSIKSVREAWSGLTFLPPDVNYTDYESITVQIYGGANAEAVNLALNDFDTQVTLQLVQGEWTKFVIPLSDFYPTGGAPAKITRMDFQEASNTGLTEYIFYVDDFGFL